MIRESDYDVGVGETIYLYGTGRYKSLIDRKCKYAIKYIKEVTKGSRYSYLANFAQGSSAPDRNVVVQDNRQSGTQGKSWLPDIAKDFKELLEKEGKPIPPVLTRLPDHGR